MCAFRLVWFWAVGEGRKALFLIGRNSSAKSWYSVTRVLGLGNVLAEDESTDQVSGTVVLRRIPLLR